MEDPTVRGPLNLAAMALALLLVASACSTPGASTDPVDASTTSTVTSQTVTTIGSDFGDGVLTDVGIDTELKVIRLGLLADLTGPFAALVTDVTDAQKVYWQEVNDGGGIDGWTVELVVANTNSNVDQHREAYDQIRSEVVAIGQATGSSTNLDSLPNYVDDQMLVVPLSWYSGWAIPEVDSGVMLEQNTNYCIESMNILDFVNDMGAKSIAVAGFDDVYGRDAIAGVRHAADDYGMTIAYEGVVKPGGDITELANGIAGSGAQWTILATNASVGSEILSGSVQSGYLGRFVGLQPSYDFRLLDTENASLYDTLFYQSVYTVAWGDDAPGNREMMLAMTEAFPDRRPSDAFIAGWNEAITMHRVLEAAIASSNLTRLGVVRAANSLDSVSFGESTPDQSYVGTPTDYVQRATAIYKPDLARYVAAGGPSQTLNQADATTGSILVRDFLVGTAAAAFNFTRPCAE